MGVGMGRNSLGVASLVTGRTGNVRGPIIIENTGENHYGVFLGKLGVGLS